MGCRRPARASVCYLPAAEAGLLREERSLVAAPDMGAVLRTLREVAAGMAFLHGCGILHRDLTGGRCWQA